MKVTVVFSVLRTGKEPGKLEQKCNNLGKEEAWTA